tara:strand:- start:2380 stop:2526 length:147 start_codon:yes stop_codon:yes gene_type:complete
MKNLTTNQKEYLNYLQNLRNDFNNKGLKEQAYKVQKDINNLMSNPNWK